MHTASFFFFIVANSQTHAELSLLANAGSAHVECTIPASLLTAVCILTLAAPFNTQLPGIHMRSCTSDATLTPALCAEVNFLAHGPRRGAVGHFDVLLVIHPSASTFRLRARDSASNDYTTSGALREWHKWQAPSRVPADKIVHHGRRLNGPASMFSEGYLFGKRRDCRSEQCPPRWTNCWKMKNTNVRMVQVLVAVVLEKTFCSLVASNDNSLCTNYVEGVFRDVNLLYESQLGIHLVMAYVFTPDVVEREFPRLGEPDSLDGERYLKSLDDYFARINNGLNVVQGQKQCQTSPKFKEVTGYEYDQFGLIHIFTNLGLKDTSKEESRSGILGFGVKSSVCTCNGRGMTKFSEDAAGDETWLTFAHEIGHNLGASHYWNVLNGLDDNRNTIVENTIPNSGIMGYSDGKINDVYEFSDIHEPEMCKVIQKQVYDATRNHTGCLRPYYGAPEIDTRFGVSWTEAIYIFISIGLCMAWVVLAACYFYFESRTSKKRLYNLRSELIKRKKLREEEKRALEAEEEQLMPASRVEAKGIVNDDPPSDHETTDKVSTLKPMSPANKITGHATDTMSPASKITGQPSARRSPASKLTSQANALGSPTSMITSQAREPKNPLSGDKGSVFFPNHNNDKESLLQSMSSLPRVMSPHNNISPKGALDGSPRRARVVLGRGMSSRMPSKTNLPEPQRVSACVRPKPTEIPRAGDQQKPQETPGASDRPKPPVTPGDGNRQKPPVTPGAGDRQKPPPTPGAGDRQKPHVTPAGGDRQKPHVTPEDSNRQKPSVTAAAGDRQKPSVTPGAGDRQKPPVTPGANPLNVAAQSPGAGEEKSKPVKPLASTSPDGSPPNARMLVRAPSQLPGVVSRLVEEPFVTGIGGKNVGKGGSPASNRQRKGKGKGQPLGGDSPSATSGWHLKGKRAQAGNSPSATR